MSEDPRAELASVAASLRAYLEWQRDTGASGIPRAARPAARASAPNAASAAPATSPTAPSPRAEPARPAAAEWVRMPEPVAAAATPSAAPSVAPRAPSPPPRPLAVIREEVASCTRCALAATRTNTVFSRGNPEARVCFVGEAPGAEEDASGVPFVGPAGQQLDKMIAAMGLDPERDAYVCNIVKCRPPENRKPTPEETAQCIPYLHEQLEVVQPRVIVALGNTAVVALLGTTIGITKLRGEWKMYRGKTMVMPTYHPSYLLRPGPHQRQAKLDAWDDLKKVMGDLGLPVPSRR